MINGYTPHAAGSGTAGEVRELKQRRRRAGRVSQLQLLAQRPKVRLLKHWADGRVRQMRVLEHMTKLRVLEQRANAHRHTPFRPRLPVWLPSCDVSSAIHVNCGFWNTGRKLPRPLPRPIQAAATMLSGSSTAAKIAGYGTAGQSCHAHCHAPFRPRLPVWLPSCDVSSAIHGRNCGYWNSGLKASTGGYQRRADRR